MKRFVFLLVVTTALAFAQKWEIGGAAGFGGIGAGDLWPTKAAVFGVEVCGQCNKKFAWFTEYNHLESVESSRNNGIKRFDIVAGGLRIQGGRRVRPFFDIGAAYGVDTFTTYSGSQAHGNAGIVLAGGVGIRLKDRLYIRPQYRIHALWGHAVVTGTVGIGARF